MADISHPPMEQLQDLEYCIDSNPPWAEAVLLAFQNYILMLGTTVMIPSLLVPAMGGSDRDKALVIQTLLFVSGINTLLQALFGTRLPAIVGGSFAYVVPIAYIINDSKLQRITDHHERFIQTMRAIQGALIVASSIQIILGYSQVWGLFSRFFSPLGMAPVVGLVGLGLFQRGFPALGNCVEIGIPMLILVIGFSQYLKHVKPLRELPIFERFPVLICVTIVWIYSIILTASGAYREKPHATQMSCRTDRANLISTAPWFKFPYPLQWGPPTFSAGHSFAMMSAVLVSMVESTGAYTAKSRLPIATPPPAYVLSRGIGWQGIGILLRRAFWNWHWFYCFSEVLMEYLLLFIFLLKSGVLQLLLSLLDYWTVLYEKGERGASWTDSSWKSESCSNICRVHDILRDFRKIRSSVCVDSISYIRCFILHPLRACSFGWIIFSSIHKHELYEKLHDHWFHS